MATWKYMPLEVPTDGETVWIRLEPWGGQPFLARWSSGDQYFTHNDSGLIVPWYMVSRWRSQ